MKRTQVDRKAYRSQDERYGEPLPLDPRELPFPFGPRRPDPTSASR